MPRNYKQEYANYDGTEAVKKKRAQRNKARRMLEATGAVKKGDGKDVDHKKPLNLCGPNLVRKLSLAQRVRARLRLLMLEFTP